MPHFHTLPPSTALLQSPSPSPSSHLLPPGATVIDTSIVATKKSTNTNGAGQTSQTQRVYSSTANGCATERNQLSLHDCQTVLVHGLCDVKGGRCERTCSGCDDTTTSTASPTNAPTDQYYPCSHKGCQIHIDHENNQQHSSCDLSLPSLVSLTLPSPSLLTGI